MAQLHGRGRFSDVQFVSRFITDFQKDGGGFLELRALSVKTSVSMEAKRTFMPIVIPAVGILGSTWAKTWVSDLQAQGIIVEDKDVEGECSVVKGCLLPETLSDGSWASTPYSSSNASKWLRELLRTYGALKVDDQVATHSLKSTPLSWAAKFGLPIEDRELLGHHSIGKHRSALTYSRDAQARCVRLYMNIITKISSGEFDPDLTRSGRFVTKRKKRDSEPDDEWSVIDICNVQDKQSHDTVDCEAEPLATNVPLISSHAVLLPEQPDSSNLTETLSEQESNSSSDASSASDPDLPIERVRVSDLFVTVDKFPEHSKVYAQAR